MKLFKKEGNEFKEASIQEIRANYNEMKLEFRKGQILDCAETAKRMIKGIGDLVTESIVVLYTDTANKIITKEVLSGKLEDQCSIHPKRILRTALSNYATGILMAHNHPSGTIEASNADDKITKKMKEACEIFEIRFLDHMIVTDTRYYSYRENGKI